jgi:hypothetical protein
MSTVREMRRAQIGSWILLAVVCAADLATPSSINVGILSLAVVLLSLWSDRRPFVLTIAGLCSVLVCVKLMLTSFSDEGLTRGDVVHSLMNWALIWVVALSGRHVVCHRATGQGSNVGGPGHPRRVCRGANGGP